MAETYHRLESPVNQDGKGDPAGVRDSEVG
jgi:hypothetical protein